MLWVITRLFLYWKPNCKNNFTSESIIFKKKTKHFTFNKIVLKILPYDASGAQQVATNP